MAGNSFKEVWKSDRRLRICIIGGMMIVLFFMILVAVTPPDSAVSVINDSANEELEKNPIIKRETERRAAEEARIKQEQEAREKAQREQELIQERGQYAQVLQNKFFDDGLNIKVAVWGNANQNLSLTFVLFNDVWVHKFKTGSLFSEITGKGFKYVVLSDGYEQSWYWNL